MRDQWQKVSGCYRDIFGGVSLMIVKEYVIWVEGFDTPSYENGKNLGEAKYNLWLKVSDCGYWKDFFDFARKSSGRLNRVDYSEVEE